MSGETVPLISRIYLTLEPGSAGRFILRLSRVPTAVGKVVAALISRGKLMQDQTEMSLQLVSDPSADPSLRGPAGKDGVDGASAYQVARSQGYGGTITQWLASLVGAAGASAYDLARSAGYGGTLTQWLASLVGAKGDKGDKGDPATTLLGTVTIAETAAVAINAGLRRLTITTPTAWGVAKGQDFALCADALPSNAYALHDAIATGPNTLSVGITTPAIALLSSYSITARLRRFN